MPILWIRILTSREPFRGLGIKGNECDRVSQEGRIEHFLCRREAGRSPDRFRRSSTTQRVFRDCSGAFRGLVGGSDLNRYGVTRGTLARNGARPHRRRHTRRLPACRCSAPRSTRGFGSAGVVADGAAARVGGRSDARSLAPAVMRGRAERCEIPTPRGRCFWRHRRLVASADGTDARSSWCHVGLTFGRGVRVALQRFERGAPFDGRARVDRDRARFEAVFCVPVTRRGIMAGELDHREAERFDPGQSGVIVLDQRQCGGTGEDRGAE
jgi:hypothetical protein